MDGADFLAWQQQIGSSIPLVSAISQVPEPCSWLLLAVGIYLIDVCQAIRVAVPVQL